MKLFLINLISLFRFDREDYLRDEMRAYNKRGHAKKNGNYCYLETRGGKAHKLHPYIYFEEKKLKPNKIYKQKLCNGEETWWIQMP